MSPAPSFPGAGPLLPRSGTRGFILAPLHHRGPKKVPQPATPCAIRLWCQLRLKWPCPNKGPCHPSSRRRGASCPPTPPLLRGDPGELGPCRLMRTRLQGQEIGDALQALPLHRETWERENLQPKTNAADLLPTPRGAAQSAASPADRCALLRGPHARQDGNLCAGQGLFPLRLAALPAPPRPQGKGSPGRGYLRPWPG